MKLYDLIATMTAEADKRLAEQGLANDYPEAEHVDIAKKVGIAALKFADLSNFRLTDYIFDLDRFVCFEGKTGPYLQYAAVRIQSILRKARDEGYASSAPVVRSPEERALVLQLLALPEKMQAAEDNRAPNILCEYAFELAQKFSRFYSEHHILSETDAELRAARIGLCEMTLATLAKVLNLLGIEIPERM
jgi:arginyl-tRNA synthetase